MDVNGLAATIDPKLERHSNAAKQVNSPSVLPRDTTPPSLQPVPAPDLPGPLPAPEDLLQPSPGSPIAPVPENGAETIFVTRFEVVGSTVFNENELAAVTTPFTHRDLTLAELYQVRSAITQLYLDAGYPTSGAYVPPQAPVDGVVTIQVVEGRVNDIQVMGNRRLNTSYVRDRLELAAEPPLNVNRLVEGLRLLQLDPLIESISAELSSGLEPGTSILTVQVTEADTFDVQLATDNRRSPTVGSWRRRIQMNEANLLGGGDGLSIGYTNTRGSNELDASYTLPINPRNGTLSFNYGITSSEVVEDPFDDLDIESDSRYYELSYRQPILQTPTEEFALSIIASRQESRTQFLEDRFGNPVPFPSLGADAEGRTRVTALRFAQEWTQRRSREVFAARSQFSIGLDLFDPTISNDAPDGRFVAWQGQGQWVRLLAPDTLALVQLQAQITGDKLVPLEQFSLGGQETVRGYRQELLLTDSGILASAELRLPVYRNAALDGLLQVVPFFDLGRGWNVSGNNPDPSTLLGIGVGVQWQQGDRFTARLDWGIPLISVESEGDTWQEDGIYFSIVYSAF